jgi:FkbM family methyltransferase
LARLAVVFSRFAVDGPSLRAYIRAAAAGGGGDEVWMRVRPLGRNGVWLRPGTSDADVLWDTFFHRYHLPPPEASAGRGVQVVWDLGANIGLTMAHMAELYPQARVFGVELDGDNARIAERNVEPWADRCTVVPGAVWVDDGEIRYHRHASPSGYNVVADARPEADTAAPARSLASLFAEHTPGEQVDYLKMDVEGSEFELLKRNTGWAAAVRTIQVEAHFGYTLEECGADLRALGFEVRPHAAHPASLVGVRR